MELALVLQQCLEVLESEHDRNSHPSSPASIKMNVQRETEIMFPSDTVVTPTSLNALNPGTKDIINYTVKSSI